MKFNKSTESDFWYVGFSDDVSAGKILSDFRASYYFEAAAGRKIYTNEMREIVNFMESIEKQSGIDTTSTFTSNSQ